MYFFRKNGGRVHAVYRKKGRLIPVPRKETEHLDSLPDEQVAKAIKRLEAVYKVKTIRPDLAACPAPFLVLLDQFKAYLRSEGRDEETVKQYDRYLRRAGAFLGWPLSGWPDRSTEFADWSKKFKASAANKTRMNLLTFWNWCLATGHATGALYVLPVTVKSKPTPLKKTLTPDKILSLGIIIDDEDLWLMVLVCYFFSIRPQEAHALTKEDFTSGKDAAELESAKVMKEAGLYERFAVRIEKQSRLANQDPKDPKTINSVAWVSCFEERAAKIIAARVKRRETDKLFEHGLAWYSQQLRRLELNFTWKDLRRASLYWIGHYTKMNRTQAKSHSRHKDDKSLDLYFRRPDENVKRKLDLDDM